MILYYDVIEEFRDLTLVESNGRNILIEHLRMINEQHSVYWKQRATIGNIKMGESNTKYFQAKATIKHRLNHIAMLKDEDDLEHYEHQAKVVILFRAFKKRLGTSTKTENPLLIHSLHFQQIDLTELEVPFSKEEIYAVIKNTPADKTHGPDGFNATFLKSCWDIVAPSFIDLLRIFTRVQLIFRALTTHSSPLFPKMMLLSTQMTLGLSNS